MANSKYLVRNIWHVAPVLTTNLLESGLVDTVFNATLTRAAVTAFDEYISIRRGKSISHEEKRPGAVGSRRRRRSPSMRQDITIKTSAIRPKSGSTTPDATILTDNDFFFEHQKTRGYRLASHALASCDCTKRLEEKFLVDAVAYYLDTVCGEKALADLLLLGTGEISIDIWAAVQRGKGAYHADHVHEGAFVSGVYYPAVPSGSAPLILRKPKADNVRRNDEAVTVGEVSDMILHPREGDLVLFPPWVEHGVPVAKKEELIDSYNLPRVSFAFNVTGAFVHGSDPWNVTRFLYTNGVKRTS